MDIEMFMDFIATQDSIKYSYTTKGISEYNTMLIVYATTQVDTLVIGGTKATLEIDIDNIKEIKHMPESNMIRVMLVDGELSIYYPSPGDNF